jgi:glycerophosphoryl diester phosphodiesterase
METKNTIRVAAHRGNSCCSPENTLPAIESALRLPIDNLEFDLHMTRDGEIILMHDHKVDRTTNGTGLIRSFSLAEIKKLDAGAWKNEQFAGTRVPTFVEFLDMMKNYPDMTFNVEFKDYPHDGVEWAHESADKAIALMERYGISERSTINTWSAELMEYIDEKYSHTYRLHGYYPLDLMGTERKRDPYEYLYCICLFGTKEVPVVEKAAFDYVISYGIQPWVYYPDGAESSFEGAIANGAVLITANDPEKTLAYLKVRGLHR